MAKILRYAEHAANDSMLNTPNTWGWYLAGLTFQWLQEQGGLAAMAEQNRAKAELLYRDHRRLRRLLPQPGRAFGALAHERAFHPARHARWTRSFLQESEAAGLLALKGHKAVGGMRASLYNAVPLEAVQALVAFMRDFANVTADSQARCGAFSGKMRWRHLDCLSIQAVSIA